MKAWAIKLSEGRWFQDGMNDPVPGLWRTKRSAAAFMVGVGRVVRVSVSWGKELAQERGVYKAWGLQGQRGWLIYDWRNDVTPALYRTKRDAIAAAGVGLVPVRIGVRIEEL